MNLRVWPSLRGGTERSGRISTRRAVYGKVHRAPTDYRWIAWSGGFDPGPAPLQKELALGREDSAASFCSWRVSPTAGAAAIKYYPSRAYDAAGRLTPIEKQVVSVPAGSGVPAVAMAFLLLPECDRLDDTVWWESWRDPRWKTLDYHLPIRDEQCPSVSLDGLEDRIRQGVAELLEIVPGDRLEEFYARLLAGSRPAFLRIPDKPFPPLALAAILLPLEPDIAEQICLAGGFPSSALDAQGLEHWNGVACPPHIVPAEAAPIPTDFCEQASDLVRLLKGAISTRGAAPVDEADLSPGGSYLVGFLESPERWFVPGERGGKSLAQVGPWPIVRGHDESNLLRERVRQFVAKVEALPSSPARQHMLTKADLLRSLLLVLCPGHESLTAVSLPKSRLIPALYFASRIEIQDWRELARYSGPEFDILANHSLNETLLAPMVREVTAWLIDCAGRTEAGQVQGYAQAALRRFAPTDSALTQAAPDSARAPAKQEG